MMQDAADIVRVWMIWIMSAIFAVITELFIPTGQPTTAMAWIKVTAQSVAFVMALAYTAFKFYRDIKEYRYTLKKRQEDELKDKA